MEVMSFTGIVLGLVVFIYMCVKKYNMWGICFTAPRK